MPMETKAPNAYPEGKNTEDPEISMEASAAEIRNLKEAFALYSSLTQLPYVECEQTDYNDQVRLYAAKADAQTEAEELEKKGIPVRVRELKTVEVSVSVSADRPEGEKKRLYLNQVRQYLGILPFIGVNAVCYKPVKRPAQTIELAGILPEELKRKTAENTMYQPNLQLTGLYFMQEARRKKEYVDRKALQELEEEFTFNLSRSGLFLAVLPPEGQEKEQKIDLKACRLPYLKQPNGDRFFPLFTDIWEFQKYVQGKKNLRPVKIPFGETEKFWVQDAKAYILNPMGCSIPIAREMIPRIRERFSAEEG